MKTALLIVDMQHDFLSPECELYLPGAELIVPAIQKLAAAARKKGWPVIYVVREHDKSGEDIEKFRLPIFARKPFCVGGTKGAETVEEIAPEPGDIVVGKTRFSGFFGTKLDLILRRMEIKRLIISGAQYPNCIRSTAVDGIGLDYDVAICPDATWGATPEVIAANIYDMRNMGIAFPSLAELTSE